MDFNSDNLISVLKTDEESIEILLKVLASGLLSKNHEVSLWASRLLLKIIENLMSFGLQPVLWQWFCQEAGGLQTCIIGLQKMNDCKDAIAELIALMARDNVCEVFNVEFKKFVGDAEYLKIIRFILETLACKKTISLQVFL